ncbi:MAG: hypothetical protein QXV18_04735 [Candidatus Nitrosocaldus sp.]
MIFKFSSKQGVAIIIVTVVIVAAVLGSIMLLQAKDTNNNKADVTTTPSRETEHEEKGVSEDISIEERVEANVKIKEVEEEEEEREEVTQPSGEEESSKPAVAEESISCIPLEGSTSRVSKSLILSLSLNKSYGTPNTSVQTVASLSSIDESAIFTITHVKFAWFSLQDGSKQLSEWEESRVSWDYNDDGYVVGEARAYMKVPDVPANTDVIITACLVEKSARSYKELGFTTTTFRVTAEEKIISYYRVDSIDDLYTRVAEAMLDRGIRFDEKRVEALLDKVTGKAVDGDENRAEEGIRDSSSKITVREGSYLFIDAAEGSLYSIGCVASSTVVKDGDTLGCFFISLDDSEYNLAIDVVYIDGRTYPVYDDVVDSEGFAYTFTHVVDGSNEGKVYVIARVDDERVILEVGLDIVRALDIRTLCTPWVDREVKILLEPTYGLPGSDVRASIGIRILPEDESMRWMFEYITVTWLDEANRTIPTSWRYAGDETTSRRNH